MDGRKLTCDVYGLIGSNFVMRDHQTGTEWQQATGVAFNGPLKGKRLQMFPFVITTWREWRAQHPTTLALVLEPRYREQYRKKAESMKRILFGSRSRAPDRGATRDDPRLPPYEQVVGIGINGAYKAYPLSQLKKGIVLNDRVGSTPVLLVHAASSDTTTAFTRLLRGGALSFRASKPGASGMVDIETGSTWTPDGKCVAGKLKGEKLEMIPPLPSFWFAWAEFHPDTQVYSAKVK